MRLVTYDRGGQRRLGAILEGEVVDLPDAVGHPAFPTTLEGLVFEQLEAPSWTRRAKRWRPTTP